MIYPSLSQASYSLSNQFLPRDQVKWYRYGPEKEHCGMLGCHSMKYLHYVALVSVIKSYHIMFLYLRNDLFNI